MFMFSDLLSHINHLVGRHICVRMSFWKRNRLHHPERPRKDVSEADDVARLFLLQEDIEASLYRLALAARKLLLQLGLGFLPPVRASLADENVFDVWMNDVDGLLRGKSGWLYRYRQLAERLGLGSKNHIRPTE
jgi:hypothetical protein